MTSDDLLLCAGQAKKFPSLPKTAKKGASPAPEEGDESDSSEDSGVGDASISGGYDYLLGMPLWSLTLERVQQLLKEQAEKEDELARLSRTAPEQLWEVDLDLFLERLQVWHATLGHWQNPKTTGCMRPSSLATILVCP